MEFGDGGGCGPPRCDYDGAPKQAKRKMKTPSQLEALEKAYTVSSTLSEQARQELAQQTSLSSREISMWFANKRFQGKQALFLREKQREDVHPLTVQSQPSGSRTKCVFSVSHQMDFSRSEVLIGESSIKLPWPKAEPPQLSIQSQALQVIPQQQISHYALDPLLLTYVERKLGGPLREDGPLVGMNFDPLPPGAFGAPFCSGNDTGVKALIEQATSQIHFQVSKETMRKHEQPTHMPEDKSFLYHNACSNKVSSISQQKDSSCLQSSHRRTPVNAYDNSGHPDSVFNLSSKLPCFPSEKLHPQTKEMHPDYALQAEAQLAIHPVNVMVDKFVLTDTLANGVTSQVKRPHKSEEAQTANKVEALDLLDACKKHVNKRKREVYDHERQNGVESVIHEKQCDEMLHSINKPICCTKLSKKGNFGEERVRQPKELNLEASVTEEADNITFKAHRNIQGNVHLIDDELLELMKLAASRKGLSSIDFLDKDTLDKLHTFQDMLDIFPPKSVIMKQAFGIPPWTESEENVGNLLMVWKFLISFAGEFGLWPFTLEEFAQALHDHDSRLLGEIHVALLKYIIRDLEDVKSTCAHAPHASEVNADNPGSTCLSIVDGAHAWGFDIYFWKRKLNYLTWPEILRQFALSAGFGPKLNKKACYPNHRGDKGLHSGDQIASLVNHDAGAINYVVQEKEFSSSCDSSYQLTPGTLEFAVFHALFLVGSKGLTSEEVADYIKEHGLCNLTAMDSAHASITNILSSDSRLFERTNLLAYRLKSCFQKDTSIAHKIYTGATEIIYLCRNMLSGIKVSNRNFEDIVLTDEIDDDLRNGVDDHHLGGKFTGENWFNFNNTRASNSLSNHHQNKHFEAGLVNKSGFENGYRVSSVSFESEEDEIVLSTLNDEFFDSNHELDRPSEDVIMSNELFSESWVQELAEEEYSSLSIEERLKVFVALIGVIVDGNLFHIFIEERLKEAQTCKKMMWTKMRLNTRLKERLNAIPTSFSKQDLSQKLCYSSNSFLPEQFDYTPTLSLSQLEVYIDQKVERIHSYKFLPLGKDRRHNRYWQFTTSSSHNDPGSGRIFFESKDGYWRVIDSDEAFDAILSALDTRGIRESHLHFMLKLIETTFKDTSRRSKNREHYAESTTDRQSTIAPDCCTSDYSTTSISVPSAYETPQRSTSFNIDFLENENERSLSKKYLQFMKWMWQECFNSDLLCAMRYGTKRCQQLLEVCHICYQSYLAEEKHCPSCHVTFIACNNAYENFSAHLALCESDFKIQLSIPFCPINFQLLKAQLAIIEVSIPIEAFHPFWNDGYRKSWGIRLNLSSSARELFQNLTLLEGAIKPDCLCPDFITTNEFLSSGKNILLDNSSTVSEPVPVIPWIPDTSAAVALRLLDLDASIPYMMQHGLEPLEGTEVGEFLVLPRSKLVNPIHQIEPVVSEDANDQNRGQRKPDKDGGGKESCTGFGQHNSESKDFSGSSYTGEANINNESSGSLRVDKSSAISSYETNAGSVNMYSKSEAWYSEDESEQRDDFGVCEAVESNECRRWQGTADSFLDSEVYLDEQQSEGRRSNIVLDPAQNPRDIKDDEFIREKGLVGEVISSSSVNTI